MGSHKVRWLEMFPDELYEAIERRPVCLLAYGLAEPHGLYNALGLDFIKADALLEISAAQHGGVVAPPCAWHVQERPEFDWLGAHGVRQSYASSVPADLFLHLVMIQLRAIDARGFHAAILVTGHYGGLERDMRLACEYYVRRTGSPLVVRALADWELIDFEDFRGDHAGVCETSQLMALRPDLVDLKRTIDKYHLGTMCGVSFGGEAGQMPSRELGASIVQSQVRRLGQIQQEMLASYEPQPGYQPPSLSAVEDIWRRFERLTRKYWWLSLTFSEYLDQQEVSFPGWSTLGE